MFSHAPEGVSVFTDTLATTADGTPSFLATKCFVISHLQMAIAVTGTLQVGHRWAEVMQTAMLTRDIDMVDAHVPDGLRKIELELAAEFGVPGKSTIYHFGWSPGSDAYVRYVYRSECNFESERHDEPGFGVKPPPSAEFDSPASIEGIIELARTIRAEQDLRPKHERLYIGGDLVETILAQRTVAVRTVYTWPDKEAHWDAMNEWLAGHNESQPLL